MSRHIDHAKLEQIVGILSEAAAELDRVAARAPEKVVSGPFGAQVMEAEQHLLDSQADLVMSTAVDALLVAEALLAYAATERINAGTLERVAQQFGAFQP